MMRRILAVDTATPVCGVALAVDGQTQIALSLDNAGTHTRHVMRAIEAVLRLGQIDLSAVDGFAVTHGPGSFTGLRIGIATVKGLAAATGKPLAGISTLAVLAHQAGGSTKMVCPMIDARRDEVYWSLYRRKAGVLTEQMPERVGPAQEIAADIDTACYFIGNGARLYRKQLKGLLRKSGRWATADSSALSPSVVARLGWQ